MRIDIANYYDPLNHPLIPYRDPSGIGDTCATATIFDARRLILRSSYADLGLTLALILTLVGGALFIVFDIKDRVSEKRMHYGTLESDIC